MVNKNYCFLNFIYDKIKKYGKIIYVDILYIGSGSMDQERIGNLIKELRKKNNLTQEKFAEKYGVTYQAVSKWENGKNIPDISLLKQICDDYNININDLLEGKNSENNQSKKVNKKKIIYISLGVLLLIIIILFIVFHDDSFTFKTVSSNCSNFEISGSIAYNKNKSYLYISNIDYCGGTDNNLYKKIECLLYEEHGMVKKQIGNYTYEKDSSIKLNDFLKDVNFSIDNFAKECKNIEKSNITLEITATDEEDKTTIYKVPLSMNKSCN